VKISRQYECHSIINPNRKGMLCAGRHNLQPKKFDKQAIWQYKPGDAAEI
jgi:hypothetical protein